MAISSFPNPLAPDATKSSQEYGLKFVKAVYDSWLNGGLWGQSRLARKARFDLNRMYAMGRQPMSQFLDILDVNGEMSVVNLAYDPLPIAIPFLNRIKDRYNQRIEKITCNAIDPFTQAKKKKARDNAMFKLHEGSRIAALQEASGVNIEDFREDDPTDENEVDIEFGFNYKEREEVIMENGIELVFYDNDWNGTIKDRILEETMVCGYAPCCVEVDGNGRIKIRPIRPENFISSSSEWNDFRDWQYQGEAYYMSIMDIRQLYPKKISEQRLFDLAKSQVGKAGNPANWDFGGWDNMYNNSPSRPWDTFKVEVISVRLKTLYNIRYEVGEDNFGKTVLDKRNTERDGKEYIKSPAYYVSYTGIWVVDTDVLLYWGLSENMIKPESNLTEIYSDYVVYMHNNTKFGNTPLIETMIPSIKIMQLTWLQQQKIIAAAAPDGYKVDIAQMSDITLGEGLSDLSPYDLYKIYKQTGIQYYKSVEDDGEGRRDVPIQPQNVPFSTKLEQLMEVWNAEYDKLQRMVGDNNLAAGIITNQATGKSVLQNAKQISESASNYIYDSYLNVQTRVARLVMYRLWDILVYGKKFGVFYYDGYKKALGTDKVEYLKLEATDDFEKTNFDVMIQVVLDDNGQQQLNNDINQALANGLIEFYDAVDIRRLAQTDLKYASYMMASRIKKRKKENQEMALQNSQMNTQQQVAAAQAKSQGEMELEKLKATLKAAANEQEHNNAKELETVKSIGIMKADVAKGILAEPDKSWQDIPAFIWDGMGIVDQSQKQLIVQSMQRQAMLQQQGMQNLIGQQQEQQPQIPDDNMVITLPDGTVGHIPPHRYNEFSQMNPDHYVGV